MIRFLWQVAATASLFACSHAQSETSSSYYTSPTIYPSPNTTGIGWDGALEKAQSFLGQLNLTEKVYIVTGVRGPCVGNIAPIPRLNFTGLCLQDGPAAIRVADYASVFPAGITTAATWDKTLFYQRAAAMGQEFKDKGAHVILAPVAGPLGRVALGGRNWEGFSPDPYLTGSAFALSVEGMQSVGAQACGKHYIGNEQETQRNPTVNGEGETILAISSNIDDRTMHELYLWPFADAVKSGMASVMCSYNRINQTYGCENSKLLNGVLKEELGFQGYVMSDWGATHSGLPAINGGLDMDMPGSSFGSQTLSFFGGNITAAVQNGSLPESRLDDMVLRIMTPYYFLGQDSYPSVDGSSADLNGYNPATSNYSFTLGTDKSRDVRGGHAQLIHDIAAQGTVLLKNENATLPLKSPKRIGVFGNDAADLVTGLYNTNNLNYAGAPGYDIGTLAVGGGSGAGRFTTLISPLEAIKRRAYAEGAIVEYVLDNKVAIQSGGRGGGLGPPTGKISPKPDVCLVFLKTYVTEGYDRLNYEADWNSTQLVANITSFCNNTVVITHSGGINTMPWAENENVTAILAAHLPGEQSGNSIVSVLWGDVNPSGHLPYTIALNESDYNTKIVNQTNTNDTDPNAWQDNFSEGLFIDYRHFDQAGIEPLYEFGFGLSYTTFNISDLSISATTNASLTQLPGDTAIQPGGNPELYAVLATVSVTVSNTGEVAGAAVPQLYVSFPSGSVPEGTPVRVLRGFEKRQLAPGASEAVQFMLTRRDLSYWDVVSQQWSLPSNGSATVQAGWSSRDLPLEGELALTIEG
ncbi:putative beta-glucosidase G [Cyphellophora attinorum]|uniref:Probable beta-glucosidase G n=1 Tax=Cyphellophora attinorum TaxID=1664694 RepID=A0A0N0NNZ6_9EURO|nr:putative beta-glucosidase G [Phialophora attinorum]KPI42161.1 putative beta-glucosidase G [Phialophora attinorum]